MWAGSAVGHTSETSVTVFHQEIHGHFIDASSSIILAKKSGSNPEQPTYKGLINALVCQPFLFHRELQLYFIYWRKYGNL